MSERIPLDAPLPDGIRHAPLSVTPSYHDLHITTKDIPRTSIFNLPYGYEVACTRVTGWQLWRFDLSDRRLAELVASERGTKVRTLAERHAEKAGGEYDGSDNWLVLDVAGHVIADSRRQEDEDET